MESQHIIGMAPVSLQTQTKWFGECAVRRMLEITDLVRPYVSEVAPNMNPSYQAYFIAQRMGDGETINRVLTNLIKDCPTFYPIKPPEQFAVNLHGFSTSTWSHNSKGELWEIAKAGSRQGVQLIPPNRNGARLKIARQEVISKRRMRLEHIIRPFGDIALDVVDAMNRYIYSNKGPNDLYGLYLVRQYDWSSDLGYEGLAFTNLVKGSPVIYPQYQKPFLVNNTNGFRTIELPQKMIDEIKSLDYRGCNLGIS